MLSIKNQKLLLLIIVFGVTSLILNSCKSKNIGDIRNSKNPDSEVLKEGTPLSEGNEYELFIVADGIESDTAIQNKINKILNVEVSGLPQLEPLFVIRYISTESFTSGNFKNVSLLFLGSSSSDKLMMSLLKKNFSEVNLDENKQGLPGYFENKFSYPQMAVVVVGNDQTRMLETLKTNSISILNHLEKSEKARIKRLVYARGSNNTQTERLSRYHSISMSLPKGYLNIFGKLPNKSDTLFTKHSIEGIEWYRWKTEAFSSDILIYYIPYSKSTFPEVEQLLTIKDKISRVFVKGVRKGSFVVTAKKYFEPIAVQTTIAGMKAIEIRGLWETEGDWMGGPFIYKAILDEENQRLVMIDGFVYAPSLSKKTLIKRMEVVLETYRRVK